MISGESFLKLSLLCTNHVGASVMLPLSSTTTKVLSNTNHVLLSGSNQGDLTCDVIKSGGSQLGPLSWLLLGVVPSNSDSHGLLICFMF